MAESSIAKEKNWAVCEARLMELVEKIFINLMLRNFYFKHVHAGPLPQSKQGTDLIKKGFIQLKENFKREYKQKSQLAQYRWVCLRGGGN